MTTLLSWVSVDSRGPSGLYIVTDSRITWGSALKRWDSGRKVFAYRSKDIFGYCGDVLFPSLVLSQLGDLIDRNLLWSGECDARTRHDTIVSYLKTSFERRHATPDQDFGIVHAARDGDNMASNYFLWHTTYDAKRRRWSDTAVHVGTPKHSQVLITLGSGHRALHQEIQQWARSPQAGTARSIFAAFCDALKSEKDPLSGGLPQIVSLNRTGGAKVIGFVEDGIRYLYGLPVQALAALEEIDWVDSLFTRVSPTTLVRLPNAQPHARVDAPPEGGVTAFLQRTRSQSRSEE